MAKKRINGTARDTHGTNGAKVESIAERKAKQAAAAPSKSWTCESCKTKNPPRKPDALVEKCRKCGEPSPRQKAAIAAGLQSIGGGINTAENVEEAARRQEGLGDKKKTAKGKPADTDLPFPKGRFDPQASWDALIGQREIVREAERIYNRLHEQAKEAKATLEREQETLNKLIDVADEKRRTDARQPYLKEDGAAAPARTPCAWEQAHPGQTCPICSETGVTALVKDKDHIQDAEVALHDALTPLVEQLGGRGVITNTLALARVTDEDRAQLAVFASGQGAVPPPVLLKAHVAGDPGDEHQRVQQVCAKCGTRLWYRESGVEPHAKDAIVLLGDPCEPGPETGDTDSTPSTQEAARRLPQRSAQTKKAGARAGAK